VSIGDEDEDKAERDISSAPGSAEDEDPEWTGYL
jgi:hypothetical protein